MIMTIHYDLFSMQIPKLVYHLYENVSFCLEKKKQIMKLVNANNILIQT